MLGWIANPPIPRRPEALEPGAAMAIEIRPQGPSYLGHFEIVFSHVPEVRQRGHIPLYHKPWIAIAALGKPGSRSPEGAQSADDCTRSSGALREAGDDPCYGTSIVTTRPLRVARREGTGTVLMRLPVRLPP